MIRNSFFYSAQSHVPFTISPSNFGWQQCNQSYGNSKFIQSLNNKGGALSYFVSGNNYVCVLVFSLNGWQICVCMHCMCMGIRYTYTKQSSCWLVKNKKTLAGKIGTLEENFHILFKMYKRDTGTVRMVLYNVKISSCIMGMFQPF